MNGLQNSSIYHSCVLPGEIYSCELSAIQKAWYCNVMIEPDQTCHRKIADNGHHVANCWRKDRNKKGDFDAKIPVISINSERKISVPALSEPGRYQYYFDYTRNSERKIVAKWQNWDEI